MLRAVGLLKAGVERDIMRDEAGDKTRVAAGYGVATRWFDASVVAPSPDAAKRERRWIDVMWRRCHSENGETSMTDINPE